MVGADRRDPGRHTSYNNTDQTFNRDASRCRDRFRTPACRKAAGLRTHILVTTGTTVFILACLGAGIKPNSDGISRVIQGIITGIGFVGAGSILKRETGGNIQGVTTSAGIWMTAAIGVTAGLGALGLAITATILTLVVLRVTIWFERKAVQSS